MEFGGGSPMPGPTAVPPPSTRRGSNLRWNAPFRRRVGPLAVDAIEPENRLVGRALEAAWEAALASVRPARQGRPTQPATLTAEELGRLTCAGAHVRAIFNASSPPGENVSTSSSRSALLQYLGRCRIHRQCGPGVCVGGRLGSDESAALIR